jgi:hypothetical protein
MRDFTLRSVKKKKKKYNFASRCIVLIAGKAILRAKCVILIHFEAILRKTRVVLLSLEAIILCFMVILHTKLKHVILFEQCKITPLSSKITLFIFNGLCNFTQNF